MPPSSNPRQPTPRPPMQIELLEAAFGGDLDKCFNAGSRTMVLKGRRGNVLAYLASEGVPNPATHRFATYLGEHTVVFDGLEAPPTVRADTTSMTWAVEHVNETRPGVLSGAAQGVGGTDSAISGLTHNMMSGGSTAFDAAGLSSSAAATDVVHNLGGLTVDGDGVHVAGGLYIRAGVSKGVSQESPLFGLLPKSFVTFFAADYLPDVQRVMRIASFVQQVNRLVEFVTGLLSLLPNDDSPPPVPSDDGERGDVGGATTGSTPGTRT